MSKRAVGWLEQDLLSFFNELEKSMPGLHCLTLSTSKSSISKEMALTGFYHVNGDCIMFDSIDELYSIWKQHQILFQKFEGIL